MMIFSKSIDKHTESPLLNEHNALITQNEHETVRKLDFSIFRFIGKYDFRRFGFSESGE